MTPDTVRVQYLFHSGFLVETAAQTLIFDYYRGPVQLSNKATYVFASHSHPDHYNRAILDWQRELPSINYIFSDDIAVNQPSAQITFLAPGQQAQFGELSVKAFGSTDLGVSFLVNCAGLSIFHAGDLNWWYWWGESPEEIAQAEKSFKEEIAKIKGLPVDLAFFPVDPRLEHNYALGATYFISEIKPAILIPMHFGRSSKAAHDFATEMKDCGTKIIPLTKRGQEVWL